MNIKNRGSQFYPHLFMLQRIDDRLIRFETGLVALKKVDDLSVLTYMRQRECHIKGEIFSTVMSENNGKIFNELLQHVMNGVDVKEETRLYTILYTNFKLLRL